MSHRLVDSADARDQDRSSGFTLIELLVVVTILGVLIAIAIPLYLNYQRSASNKAVQSDVRAGVAVLEQCKADNGAYPQTSAVTFDIANGVCGSHRINTSNGSTLIYTSTAPYESFMLVGYSSSGDLSSNSYGRKTYCFNSAAGGSVAALTGSAITC